MGAAASTVNVDDLKSRLASAEDDEVSAYVNEMSAEARAKLAAGLQKSMGCGVSSDAKPAEAQAQAEAAKIVVERKALPERTDAEIKEIVAKIEAALAEDPDSLRVLGNRWAFAVGST